MHTVNLQLLISVDAFFESQLVVLTRPLDSSCPSSDRPYHNGISRSNIVSRCHNDFEGGMNFTNWKYESLLPETATNPERDHRTNEIHSVRCGYFDPAAMS